MNNNNLYKKKLELYKNILKTKYNQIGGVTRTCTTCTATYDDDTLEFCQICRHKLPVICPICTLKNLSNATICAVCGNELPQPLPPQQPVQPPQPLPPQQPVQPPQPGLPVILTTWVCTHCTTENSNLNKNCEACGNNKPIIEPIYNIESLDKYFEYLYKYTLLPDKILEFDHVTQDLDLLKVYEERINIINKLNETINFDDTKSLTNTELKYMIKDKPIGYNVIFGHGTLNSYNLPIHNFEIPVGMKVVMFTQSSEKVFTSIDKLFFNVFDDKNIIFKDCIQNSPIERNINPSILFSSKDNTQGINYNICSICNKLTSCPSCDIINSKKISDTDTDKKNCYFSIYEGGTPSKTISNQFVYWDPEYESTSGKAYSKTGIYNLPNTSLFNEFLKLFNTTADKEEIFKKCFSGSYMPNNIASYPFEIVGDIVKMMEEQAKFSEEKKIIYDGDEICAKYNKKCSLLSDILRNLPIGTKNNPIVYFIRICRSVNERDRVQLVRQRSIKLYPSMLRQLSISNALGSDLQKDLENDYTRDDEGGEEERKDDEEEEEE